MKTLDEVIKANECCDHGEPDSKCEDCPYNGIGACLLERETDALYYLKEFQGLSKMWNDKLDKEQENPPLDWETLKQMGGKPVWIEYMDDEQQAGWALIAKSPERPMFGKPKLFTLVQEDGKFYLTIFGYGKRWKAYRKERNENVG